MRNALSGKVALVTGGARGTGTAIATALASEGADVAISYWSSAEASAAVVAELQALGGRAAAFKADYADFDDVERLVRSVVASFGRIDILVNNVSVTVTGTVDNPDNDLDAFDRQYAINVMGTVQAIRTAAQLMEEGGRIVSIGSVVATRVGMPGIADHAASRAAVVGYSRGAARDLAPRGITVNVVQALLFGPEQSRFSGSLSATHRAAIDSGAHAKDIASAVVFLARAEASFITGTVIDVDGGYCA